MSVTGTKCLTTAHDVYDWNIVSRQFTMSLTGMKCLTSMSVTGMKCLTTTSYVCDRDDLSHNSSSCL